MLRRVRTFWCFRSMLHPLVFSIDKVLHSLGPKMGYALPERSLPNPIDITLVFAQKVRGSPIPSDVRLAE